MYKALIIGTSLSGKTTLVQHLRDTTSYQISELDEKLTDLNGGTFPTDVEYKHKILFPKILDELSKEKNTIFFTNVWYFSKEELLNLKKKGFTIIYLNVSLKTLKSRNTLRINKGYEDMEKYLADMVLYKDEISSAIDKLVDGEQTIDCVSNDILNHIKG